jgi:tetratricopeptide (TPR) repeat protein
VPRPLTSALSLCCHWGLALLTALVAPAQQPAPAGDGALPPATLVRHGSELLEIEDPLNAWQSFRRALQLGDASVGCFVGLGSAHLMLGNSAFALAWAEAALRSDADDQAGMALCVRALIRAREFDAAVQRASGFVARSEPTGPELLAARASALFRVQRIPESANVYQRVVAGDPLHPEGHLRLGSGLLGPVVVDIPPGLTRAVASLTAGDRAAAVGQLQDVLREHPGHPIAHRLLGETLFAQRTDLSMAANDPAFAALAAMLPVPDVRRLPVAQFVPGYERLSPARKRVVDRTAAMFARHLTRLVAVGGRHDLLRELERTTDANERANLRGKRTFDGRVWDDVRGVGGVQAATGIEALDDAAAFGFDTLAHEVAHQAHYFTFTPLQRARIRSLYHKALAEGRCLDYYAASNEAEYFGQGVEAFASLAKRPGGETTHGHTRFELHRVDRDLHDFVAEVVDHDPLAAPGARERVLAAAIAVALRCGRPLDAVTAAAMLAPGATRDRLAAAAAAAVAAARCH